MKVGPGFVDGVDIGPLCYPEAKVRVERILGTVESEGGVLELDGRGYKVEGYPNGFFVGPSIISGVTDKMTCY